MKKFIFPTLAIFIIGIASCTKKEDVEEPQDDQKVLAQAEWNVSTASIITDTTTSRSYTDGTPNTLDKKRVTFTISNGERAEEKYLQQDEVGSPSFFVKETSVSDYSLTYKFNEGGAYTSNQSSDLKSITYESTGNPPSTNTFSSNVVTSSNAGTWSWQINTGQKPILTFDLGALQVDSISENVLELKLNTSDTQTTVVSNVETRTKTNTQTIAITMTR